MNAIFTSEKIEKSDELVDAINNLKINNSGCELNTATVSDAQGDLESNPDTVTNTSNRIFDQKIFSCRTIREVSVLPPTTNLIIDAIILAPPTLLMPVVN